MIRQIGIEETLNEYTREYHFRRETTKDLRDGLAKLPGVAHVGGGRRYSVLIIRARMYSWKEIEPGILAEIQFHDFLGADFEANMQVKMRAAEDLRADPATTRCKGTHPEDGE